MSIDYTHIEKEARERIAACQDSAGLEALRVQYLGRRGLMQELMSKIPTLPEEERKSFGFGVNTLKKNLTALIAQKDRELDALSGFQGTAFFDASLPGKRPLLGRQHLLTKMESEITGVFENLGFRIFQGPEIETEYNNFEALNIPLEHPSRDAFDTFYIQQKRSDSLKSSQRFLLRSHTSPGQIRAMKVYPPPVAVIVPGRVYRPDAVDASHSFMFHQIEGFAVDEAVRFSDLKGLLTNFAREMFGLETRMRFRPSFFPFTEPSAEVDISCIICSGQGCSVCKGSGWLEILGCGMIHPSVFRAVGYNPRRFKGFAFGMGVERIAMLKHGIADIRLFFENDLRFLEQF